MSFCPPRLMLLFWSAIELLGGIEVYYWTYQADD